MKSGSNAGGQAKHRKETMVPPPVLGLRPSIKVSVESREGTDCRSGRGSMTRPGAIPPVPVDSAHPYLLASLAQLPLPAGMAQRTSCRGFAFLALKRQAQPQMASMPTCTAGNRRAEHRTARPMAAAWFNRSLPDRIALVMRIVAADGAQTLKRQTVAYEGDQK